MAQMINEMANKGNDFGDKANEMLEGMAEDLGKNYDTHNDEGSEALLDDLVSIVYEAFHYEFHDFKNEKYATPKVELVKKLSEIIENAKDGKYDN